jgi:hypothetical protein
MRIPNNQLARGGSEVNSLAIAHEDDTAHCTDDDLTVDTRGDGEAGEGTQQIDCHSHTAVYQPSAKLETRSVLSAFVTLLHLPLQIREVFH